MLQHVAPAARPLTLSLMPFLYVLSAAIARGFLQRIKSETRRDNLDTTVGKLQLE